MPGIFLKDIIANNKSNQEVKDSEINADESGVSESVVTSNIKIGSKFDKDELNKVVSQLIERILLNDSKSEVSKISKNTELLRQLESMNVSPAIIAENPKSLHILLSSKFTNKIDDKRQLSRLLALAIKSSTRDNAVSMTKHILESKIMNSLNRTNQYSLQTAIEAAIGDDVYLRLYEQSQTLASMPSSAMRHIESFTRLLPRLVERRRLNIDIHKDDHKDAGKAAIAKAVIGGGVGAFAHKIVKKAIQDKTLKDSAKVILDSYFEVLKFQSLKVLPEINDASIMNEDLLACYFLKFNQRISYSEKSIYLNYTSLAQFFEYLNLTSFNIKDMGHSVLRRIMDHETSQDEETLGFKYKLTEEELLKMIELIDGNVIKDHVAQSFSGYLAANSDSIPIISHAVKEYSLSDVAKRVAYEKLSIELILSNKDSPKEIGNILSNLQNYMKIKSMTPFSILLETVVTPVLQKNYSKAWKSAYHSLIKPGQHDLVSSMITDYVTESHRKLFTMPDDSYKPNANMMRE